MDTTSSAKRQEKVLEIVQENTLQMLDLPPAQAQWIHAGDIADKLGMDRTNVARELNKLYRDGQLIKVQGKPTLYICRNVLSRRYPGVFFPSTLPKGSNPLEQSTPQEPPAPKVSSGTWRDLDALVGVGSSMRSAVLHAKAAVMYPNRGLHTLITGPVGVGKARFAEMMYEHAVNRGALPPDAPFVNINCQEHNSAPRLLMNQLFGYSRDAAPKGEKSRRGLIERAAGGILCLNGVEKLPPDVLDVLITLLEKNIYSRIGEASVTRYANVMVIAISTDAPNDPSMQALSQRFPAQIRIPELKDRQIQELTEILVDTFRKESEATGLSFRISREVFSCFLKATYPGNLGELSSAVRTTCSLAYLDYSTGGPPGKILEIQFGHLPQEVLRTIQEDRRRDQQVRDLLMKQDFRYLLFTPSGFSTDRYSGAHFLELLRKPEASEQEGAPLPASLTIVSEHLRNYLQKNVRNNVNRFSVLRDLFPEPLLEALSSTLNALPEYRFLLEQPTALHRLASCLHDDLQGKLPPLPNAAWLFQNLSGLCPEEVALFTRLQENLQGRKMGTLSLSAGCFTVACLSLSRRRSGISTVQIILICHGNNIATEMAEYANNTLASPIVHSLCYRQGMNFDELLCQASSLAQQVDQGSGVLLMVDMDPLTRIHEHIRSATGIHAETVPNVTLSQLLTTARRASEDLIPLHELTAEIETAGVSPGKEPSFLDRIINDVLAPALTFLNPQKAVDVLSTTLTEILRSLHVSWSTEIAAKFIFHCSHMLERLIQGEPLRYDRLKVFVNQNASLMNELERQMQYPCEVFGVSIPASELAYVAEIFIPYIS